MILGAKEGKCASKAGRIEGRKGCEVALQSTSDSVARTSTSGRKSDSLRSR
jgi:hypothetical protein